MIDQKATEVGMVRKGHEAEVGEEEAVATEAASKTDLRERLGSTKPTLMEIIANSMSKTLISIFWY